jgi:hypothetical protein
MFQSYNDPDLVQAFLKKWWLNKILKRQTSRSHYDSKFPTVTITVFKYRNKIGKIVVKAVPYSVTTLNTLQNITKTLAQNNREGHTGVS